MKSLKWKNPDYSEGATPNHNEQLEGEVHSAGGENTEEVEKKKLHDEFMKYVFIRHGFHKFVVSNRGPLFLSSFWKALLQSQGLSLDFSSTYYPKTNDQTLYINVSKDI